MEVFFYRDKNGDEPVANYLRLLKANDCKDNRINLQKIQDYISLLELRGTSLGEPYIKHIEDELSCFIILSKKREGPLEWK